MDRIIKTDNYPPGKGLFGCVGNTDWIIPRGLDRFAFVARRAKNLLQTMNLKKTYVNRACSTPLSFPWNLGRQIV
jgi:hypothetical protein